MVRSVPKVRIAVISATVAALAVAVAAAVLPASAAAPPRLAGQADAGQATSSAMTAEVSPDFTRIPGVARRTPPTTGQCEQSLHIACYTPNQIRAAYQLPTLYGRGITGRGETIVIEDSYGSPTIKFDLATFDRQFGYPNPPKFSVIQPIGKVAKFNPKNAKMAGWQDETSLDVEYAHAGAPGASIVLVETPATGGGSTQRQVMQAEEYIVNHKLGAMISESF